MFIYEPLYNLTSTSIKLTLILGAGLFLGKYLENKLKTYLNKIYSDKIITNLLARLTFILIVFIALATAAHELNINISALLATAGVFGVAIGFAAQTSFSNIISGLFLLIEQPFGENDLISIENIRGRVKSISFFSTTLITIDNKLIRIPHEKILKNIMINESKMSKRLYMMELPVAIENDFEKVKEVITTSIENNTYNLKESIPLIRVKTVETGMYKPYMNLTIGMWVKKNDIIEAKNTLAPEIKKALEQNNIKLI